MKRFFKEIKKYGKYITYSTSANLRREVANSHLSWLWWILEPFCFMLVYVFISTVVFTTRAAYFPLFVFIGITVWQFFNKCISASVKMISSNKNIVKKIYIPKYVLVLIKMGVNFVKMLICVGIVFILILFLRVPLTPYALLLFPLLIVLVIVTFGASCIMMHCGVFAEDLKNITNILLRLAFYMSGIFYAIGDRVPAPYNELLLKLNPIAYVIDSVRVCLMDGKMPDLIPLAVWFVIGLILSIIGISLIYKYENTYVKIIK